MRPGYPRYYLTFFVNSGMYSRSELVAPLSQVDEKSTEVKESNHENVYCVCGMGS